MGKGRGRPRKFGKESKERKEYELISKRYKTSGKRLEYLMTSPRQRKLLLREGIYLGGHLQEKSPEKLMEIPGIGPETAKKLYRSVGIKYSEKELKRCYQRTKKKKRKSLN